MMRLLVLALLLAVLSWRIEELERRRAILVAEDRMSAVVPGPAPAARGAA